MAEANERRPAWQAAEILEEIAKKAEPIVVYQKSRDALLSNAKRPNVGFTIHLDPGLNGTPGSIVMQYRYPVSIFADVEGTPEDIVEWLRTGLSEGQRAEVEERGDGLRSIVITQKHSERWMIDDLNQLTQEFWERVTNRRC